MRMVDFSNPSAQPFSVASIQILAPLFARIKNAWDRRKPAVSPARGTRSVASVAATEAQAPSMALAANPGGSFVSCTPAVRTGLRIVREFDSAVGADCAGRMVISGRMADVCAELDRMALRAGEGA